MPERIDNVYRFSMKSYKNYKNDLLSPWVDDLSHELMREVWVMIWYDLVRVLLMVLNYNID